MSIEIDRSIDWFKICPFSISIKHTEHVYTFINLHRHVLYTCVYVCEEYFFLYTHLDFNLMKLVTFKYKRIKMRISKSLLSCVSLPFFLCLYVVTCILYLLYFVICNFIIISYGILCAPSYLYYLACILCLLFPVFCFSVFPPPPPCSVSISWNVSLLCIQFNSGIWILYQKVYDMLFNSS